MKSASSGAYNTNNKLWYYHSTLPWITKSIRSSLLKALVIINDNNSLYSIILNIISSCGGFQHLEVLHFIKTIPLY